MSCGAGRGGCAPPLPMRREPDRAEHAAARRAGTAGRRPARGPQPRAPRRRSFGVYVHVPFCAVRCGYCDFNTYTSAELGGGADQVAYAAHGDRPSSTSPPRCWTPPGCRPAPRPTVFFGGGTPTLLPARRPRGAAGRRPGPVRPGVRRRGDHRGEPGLASPRRRSSSSRRRGSRGSRSGCSPPCRTCSPRSTAPTTRRGCRRPCAWARAAGLAVSLDLIYGTPGRVRRRLARQPRRGAGVRARPRLRVRARRRGGHPAGRPGPSRRAARPGRRRARRRLRGGRRRSCRPPAWAGTRSATGPGRAADACRHNLGYWRGDDWWGVGPGAHSHVGGVRWWNVRHPRAYAARLADGGSPGAGPRGARRGRAVRGAGAARRAARRGTAARGPLRRPAGSRSRASSRTGWPTRRPRSWAAGWC